MKKRSFLKSLLAFIGFSATAKAIEPEKTLAIDVSDICGFTFDHLTRGRCVILAEHSPSWERVEAWRGSHAEEDEAIYQKRESLGRWFYDMWPEHFKKCCNCRK